MSLKEIEGRLTALEKEVASLRKQLEKDPAGQKHWWRDGAGRFQDDSEFEEMVRLGREYRESLRPSGRKKKASVKKVGARNGRS